MSIRRLNFTHRQKIARANVTCTLRRSDGQLTFDASIDLQGYQLPPDAHVWIEAARGIERERFFWGTVSSPAVPAMRSLSRFSSEDGLTFRLIIAAPDSGDRAGLLLGEASNIKPELLEGSVNGARSLLPVAVDPDLGQRLWRIVIGSDGPVLQVHPDVGGKSWAASADFRASVLPSGIREVLTHILLADMPEWPVAQPDENNWRSLWLWWARSLPSVGAVPDGPEYEDAQEWVDSVVEQFSIRIRARDLWVASKGEQET